MMTVFTENELRYLQSQRLGRLATLGSAGEPNNVPVGFRYNSALQTIDIGGLNLSESKKFRNIQRDDRVSFVVDDVLPPRQPRGMEIRGVAEAIIGERPAYGGGGMDSALIRVRPLHIISWGIDTDAYQRSSRKVNAAE